LAEFDNWFASVDRLRDQLGVMEMSDQMGSDTGAKPAESGEQRRRPWTFPAVADENVARTAAKINNPTENGNPTTPEGPS